MNKVFDFVFRVETFLAVAAGLLLYVIFIAEEQRIAERVHTSICYNKGMVLVDTDAGQRCADPKSLVKVK